MYYQEQEMISLQQIPNTLKVLYSFAGYKRTSDKIRMTNDNILNLLLTEIQNTQFRTTKDLIYHKIDSVAKSNDN
jgi:hypothetical protein